jgi:hypothetical protein
MLPVVRCNWTGNPFDTFVGFLIYHIPSSSGLNSMPPTVAANGRSAAPRKEENRILESEGERRSCEMSGLLRRSRKGRRVFKRVVLPGQKK